jgi:tRNA-dihydrouridine synthase 1
MMIASEFVKEATAANLMKNKTNNSSSDSSSSSSLYNNITNSNICEFQSIPADRPLVVHFAANDPTTFATAAQLVEQYCDAIDLNLGCPQRTAYLGHFGSYLLTNTDRQLICNIIRAGSKAVSIPIFVKIRLLDTIDETITLCHQLRDAGASLIAIHARYRASWERTSASARDGPALLDQVAIIKKSMPHFPIIANGNVITYKDVITNLECTGADGIMSAEGILDNPALFLPRYGTVDDINSGNDCEISIPILSPLFGQQHPQCNTNHHQGDTSMKNGCDEKNQKMDKAIRKLRKKLREVETIEEKIKVVGIDGINDDQRSKLQLKSILQMKLNELEHGIMKPVSSSSTIIVSSSDRPLESMTSSESDKMTIVKLSELYKAANDKLGLAKEYLSLVRSYPMKIRSVIFHVRRMCKEHLVQYQLLEECIACTTVDEVEVILTKCEQYIKDPGTFHYDQRKAIRDKEALDAKRREEDKRRIYEGRMIRKAKREGLVDHEHYLRIGAEIPSVEIVTTLKHLSKEERLAVWKKDHSQHCMSYHLDDGGCTRDRACAFLHVPAKDGHKFDEEDEVAG